MSSPPAAPLLERPAHPAPSPSRVLADLGPGQAVNGLVVTWDGMASKVTYGGNGKSVADGAMIVSTPDAATPLGLKATGGFYTGTTFAKLPYDKPCSTT